MSITLAWTLAALLQAAPSPQVSATAPAAPRLATVVLKGGRELRGELAVADHERVVLRREGRADAQFLRHEVRSIVRDGDPPGLMAPTAPPVESRPASAPAATAYTRATQRKGDAPGTLQTAYTRWHREKGDTTLFLVGAVHIAEPEYYHQLQQILDSTDVVLFEGVGRKKGGEEIPAEERARFDALFDLQLRLGGALGLEFQKHHLDYTHSFWRNADIDVMTLNDEMRKRDVSLPTDNPLIRGPMQVLLGMVAAAADGDPAMSKQMRASVAPYLGNARGAMMQDGSGLMEVILKFRNDVAWNVLQDELRDKTPGRWISLFYGAAHLPDLDARLRADGWTCEGIAWLDAWRF